MIKEAAKLILASERPIIYAGGGILKARAAEALRELAELVDIHVVTTLMARGAFPDDHPLCLGMPGMHGNATAITAMQKSDLLITLGARFDDRITGKVERVRPRGQGHPRRHRPGRAGQGPPPRRADRRRRQVRHRGDHQGDQGPAAGRRRPRPTPARGRAASAAGASSSRSPTSRASPARRSSRSTASSSSATRRPRAPSSCRASASTRCGAASTGSSTSRTPG